MGEAETPKSWFTLLLEWIPFYEKKSIAGHLRVSI